MSEKAMKKQWFETWFESDLYDLMYHHRDEEEAELFLAGLLTRLHIAPNSLFLDLACGTGRHARYISKLGYHVTGIDLSKRKIARASEFANDQLEFFIQDMRKPFRINYFDVILNLFTSFGYFDDVRDNIRVIKSVRSGLRNGGFFIIDYLNAEMERDQLIANEYRNYGDWSVCISKRIVADRLIKEMDWTNGKLKRSYSEKVTLFSLEQFQLLLTNHGFQIHDIFGDYHFNAFDPTTSPRLILCCS